MTAETAANVETSTPEVNHAEPSVGSTPSPGSSAPPPQTDIPQQVPPPPHIMLAIMNLPKDNLEGVFRRIGEDIQSFIDKSDIAGKYNFLFCTTKNDLFRNGPQTSSTPLQVVTSVTETNPFSSCCILRVVPLYPPI